MLVALMVAPLHGTKVAQWRKSLSVVLGGFLLGALLLSALPAERLPTLLRSMLEPRERVAFSLVSNLVWSLVLLISWTGLSLVAAALLSLPLAGTLTLLLGVVLALFLVDNVGSASIARSPSLGPIPSSSSPLMTLLMETALVHGGLFLGALLGTAGSYWMLMRSFEQEDPLAGTLQLLPLLYPSLLAVYAGLLTAALGCLYGLGYLLILSLSLAVSLTVALLTLLWARLLMVNRTKRHVFERYPPHCLEYSGVSEERLAERGMVVGRESPVSAPSRESTLSGLNRQRAEESLAFLLLTATGLSAIVQGANDVGLIRGLASVLIPLLTGRPLRVEPILSTLPLMSILSAVVGIIVLTGRFTGRLAHDLTMMTPSMALAVELGCSIPALIALVAGYPMALFVCRWPALLLVIYLSQRGIQRRVAWLISGGALGGVLLPLAVVGMTSFLGRFILISMQQQ